MRLPPVAKRFLEPTLVAAVLGLAIVLSGSMLGSRTAAAEPSIQPLAGEPIIRTLEAGEAPSPASSVGFTKPATTSATPSAARTTSNPSTDKTDKAAATTAVTRRTLGLYAIVVLSLLGVMVIAIWLILRRGSESQVVATPSPMPAALVSPPAQPLIVSPRELHAGDPAWTRPTPVASLSATTSTTDSEADTASSRPTS